MNSKDISDFVKTQKYDYNYTEQQGFVIGSGSGSGTKIGGINQFWDAESRSEVCFSLSVSLSPLVF